MLKVRVNGKMKTFPVGLTVLEFLKIENVDPKIVAVEVNQRLIEREEYESLVITSGDKIEYLAYMSGGEKKAEAQEVKQVDQEFNGGAESAVGYCCQAGDKNHSCAECHCRIVAESKEAIELPDI